MIGKKFITESGLKICVIGITINQQKDFGLITLTKEELNKLKEIKNDN